MKAAEWGNNIIKSACVCDSKRQMGWEKKQNRNHEVYRESGILLTLYHHLLKGEHRGNPRCSLPSVPISSSLFCRLWHSKTISKAFTSASPHDHQYCECNPFILFLCLAPIYFKSSPSTIYFLWHSWALYCCCHFWVTSGYCLTEMIAPVVVPSIL